MTIIIAHKQAGLTAAEFRSTLKSRSMMRSTMEFTDNRGNKIVIPPNTDIVDHIDKEVARQIAASQDAGDKPAFLPASGTGDYLEQSEKSFTMNVLKDKYKYKFGGKDTGSRNGAEREWEIFVVSFSTKPNPQTINATKAAIDKIFGTTEAFKKLDGNGKVEHFTGINGRRAIFISEEHDNTGNLHFHVAHNRFAIDFLNREASKGADYTKGGVNAHIEKLFQNELAAAGINETVQFESKNKAASINNQQREGQDNAAQLVRDAGGVVLGEDLGMEMADADGQVNTFAVPRTPEVDALMEQSQALQNRLNRTLTEAAKLQDEAKQLAPVIANIQAAARVLGENALLTAEKERLEKELAESQAAKDALVVEHDEVEAKRQTLHDSYVNIGTSLAAIKELGFAPEQAEALQRGDKDAIGAIVGTLSEQVAVWNEALDQIEDPAISEALRADPTEHLNALITEALASRTTITKLTAERDGLQGQLTTANTLTTELRGQLEAKASDLADLEARMVKREEEFERQMDDMVKKVQAVESEVARAEGKVLAKQEQLEAEQGKVKELTRTKDAIMAVMTSNDPHAAWEQSKDLFKDDIFANRAMGAFLRTASELEQAQQNVTKLEADVVDLGQVKLALEKAEATAKENLVVVNDAGVADLRTLATEYKKTLAANTTLEQQIADLTTAAQVDQAAAEKTKQALEAARQEASTAKQEVATVQQSAEALRAEQEKAMAEVERLKAELEQAKAQTAPALAPEVQQLADYLAANPNMAKALAVIQSDPDWAALVEEASDNTELRTVMLDITGPSQGLQQADYTQGGITPGPDYTQELKESDQKKGPKKDGPDQGNNP